MFRMMVQASERLKQYERLQGLGYEGDMRGVAKFFYPLAELNQLEKEGKITTAEKKKLIAPIEGLQKGFVTGKMRTMSFDSSVYESQDSGGPPVECAALGCGDNVGLGRRDLKRCSG